MPHQCLNCNEIYEDNSEVIIKGCPKCGHKLFLYIRERPKEEENEIILNKKEKANIEKQVKSIIGGNLDTPIILKLENIRVLKNGKYEIDINQLLKKEKPLIFKIQSGTYIIDLTSFNKLENE